MDVWPFPLGFGVGVEGEKPIHPLLDELTIVGGAGKVHGISQGYRNGLEQSHTMIQ